MSHSQWLKECSPAFRLMIATSWLAPPSLQPEQSEAIRLAADAGVDWDEYLRLVRRHRTPALSWAALKRAPGWDAPEIVKRELKQRSDACRMRAVGHALLLADVLKEFNRDGISAMPIKGPILSLALYGDVGLRQSNDLDIMVAPRDVVRAQESLQRLGWQLHASYSLMTARQWQAILQHEHHVAYMLPKGPCRLELHWRNLWDSEEQTARRWMRTTPSYWRGQPFEALNPVDAVLDLCSHGSEHAWFRAKWLGDVARICCAGLVDWPSMLEEARRLNQERPLLLSLRLSSEAYGLPFPPGLAAVRRLPSFLMERAVVELTSASGRELMTPMERLWKRFCKEKYDRLLRPQTSLRKSVSGLSYCRLDFKLLRLPDRLFWAYAPLRPFLWIWRRMIRETEFAQSISEP